MTRIGIIGTGYVGLVSGSCFADLGFQVTCLDIIPEKVNMINQAIPPIFENGLDKLLEKVVNQKKTLVATLDRQQTFENSDIFFICLATPSSADGSIELKYIIDETKELGKLLAKTSDYKVIVVKSTVIPGTTVGIVKDLLEEYSGKKAGQDFGLAMNPEFLMEGLAIHNFAKPDRIVIGAYDDKSFNAVNELYSSFECPIQQTSLSGAEMIKYAANSFLATKISFINEIANMCEILGINVSEVSEGIGMDDRISSKFLRAGLGFGGSCFPKDVKALNALGREIGAPSNILQATLNTNYTQPIRAVKLLSDLIDVKGKTITLLGLAFKPETDDMREAPSIIICQKLIELGALVKGYDPVAKETARKAIPNITHVDSVAEAMQDSDAVILVTEWPEFQKLTPEDLQEMNGKIIIDGRRILDWKEFKKSGYSIKVIGQAYP